MHEVALLDDQVSVVPLPLAIVLGLALMLTVALGLGLTLTVADCAAVPPGPLQVSVKVVVAATAPVDCEPWTAFVPDQPPEAAQAVALVADQFNIALPPLVIELGPTLRLTLGAADLMEIVADWLALPPGPEQVSV